MPRQRLIAQRGSIIDGVYRPCKPSRAILKCSRPGEIWIKPDQQRPGRQSGIEGNGAATIGMDFDGIAGHISAIDQYRTSDAVCAVNVNENGVVTPLAMNGPSNALVVETAHETHRLKASLGLWGGAVGVDRVGVSRP
jgi:hypothetical protein